MIGRSPSGRATRASIEPRVSPGLDHSASVPNATWALFLDDERDPKTGRKWTVARSFHEAKALCNALGCPRYISFDHDLGGALTGHDFARWLIRSDMERPGFIPNGFEYEAHTANVVGRANIEGLLDGYLRHRAASAGEAGTAETVQQGSVHEHATAESRDAQP